MSSTTSGRTNEPRPNGEWSRDECIDALREAADEVGRSPTTGEYEELDIWPHRTTITSKFDGWAAAKRAAGLETNEQRGNVPSAPETVFALGMLADSGNSYPYAKDVAAELGDEYHPPQVAARLKDLARRDDPPVERWGDSDRWRVLL